MSVYHYIDLDIKSSRTPPIVDAVRGEENSRKIQIDLYNGGQYWTVPSGVQCVASYRKPDGTGGLYDVLPSGNSAFEIGSNYIVVTLAPQVLTVVGEVSFSVNLMYQNEILNTFPLIINVEDNPGLGLAESRDYFGLEVAVSMAVNTATTARYLISVEKQDDGTLVSNATVAALDLAYTAKKIIMCYYAGFLYYLTGIAKENGSNVYIFNSHASNGVSRFLNVGTTVTEQNLNLKHATFVVSANYNEATKSYICSHTADEIADAYRNRQSVVLFFQSYLYPLVGIYEDSNGWVAKFALLKTNGIITEFLVFSGNSIDFINEKVLIGDDLNTIPPCNYSNFSVFKSFGVIGDSLSRGVYRDDVLQKNVEDLNQSWGNFLAKACGNQHVSLGFSGATTATWLRDRLDTLRASNCDVYILALGYNDSIGGNVRLGFIEDITGEDTMVDRDGVPQVYGTYYFNVEKILRKINEYHPNAKTFVLTNPSFENRDDSYVYDYNKALRNVVKLMSEREKDYHVYLVDLADTYDFVFKMTESDRELQHFHPQLYNYLAQIISVAIGNVMMRNPVDFEDFLNKKYVEEKYIPDTYSINLFNPADERNRSRVFIDVLNNRPAYSPYNADSLGVTHPIKLVAGTKYKAVHADQMGGVFRVARVDVHGNIVQSYSLAQDGSFYSDYIQIETDAEGLRFLVFTAPETDLYIFNYIPNKATAVSNQAFMVCEYDNFPTQKKDGILEYVPYQKILSDKIGIENVVGGQPETLYVHFTPESENSAISDKTFSEIVNAYEHRHDVKCIFDSYILPLCVITQSQVIFGGATSTLTIFVTQLSDNSVQFQLEELATKQQFLDVSQQVGREIPLIKKAHGGQILMVHSVDGDGVPTGWSAVNLSNGGSDASSNVFSLSFTTEEDLSYAAIAVPVDLSKTVIMNVHMTFQGVAAPFDLYADLYGGSASILGKIPAGQAVGAHWYWLKHSGQYGAYSFTTDGSTPINAKPGAINSLIKVAENRFLMQFFTLDEAVIPAGTTFEIWGVCEQ